MKRRQVSVCIYSLESKFQVNLKFAQTMLNIKQGNLSLFQLNIIILKIIYIHVFPVLVSLQPEKCKPFQLSLSLEQKIESIILMGCAPFTMIPVYTLPAARNRLLWRKLYFEVQKRLLPIYVACHLLKDQERETLFILC